MIPSDPDARLTGDELATALTEAGYRIRPATLMTKGTRGGGPPYELFNRRRLYPWGLGLAWAKSRTTPPRRSTSEADRERPRGRAPREAD
jgi:hypothetical protein